MDTFCADIKNNLKNIDEQMLMSNLTNENEDAEYWWPYPKTQHTSSGPGLEGVCQVLFQCIQRS